VRAEIRGHRRGNGDIHGGFCRLPDDVEPRSFQLKTAIGCTSERRAWQAAMQREQLSMAELLRKIVMEYLQAGD